VVLLKCLSIDVFAIKEVKMGEDVSLSTE